MFFFDDVQNILDSASSTFETVICIGDMNCKHSDFYARDKTCNAGKVCKELFDSDSYDQLIREPTRFSGNSQSCIDLLFTNIGTNQLFPISIMFL